MCVFVESFPQTSHASCQRSHRVKVIPAPNRCCYLLSLEWTLQKYILHHFMENPSRIKPHLSPEHSLLLLQLPSFTLPSSLLLLPGIIFLNQMHVANKKPVLQQSFSHQLILLGQQTLILKTEKDILRKEYYLLQALS